MTSYNQKATPFVLNNHICAQVAAKYSGYSLQYLRRLLRNGKLEGIKIGQIWLIDKGALKDEIKVQILKCYRISHQAFQLWHKISGIEISPAQNSQ